jgi:molybdate transport system ATP-binding protein
MTERGGLSVAVGVERPFAFEAAFECGPGELLAIVGPSGSGKSTLLRCVAGLAAGARGRITCGGETWLDTSAGISRRPYERRVGFVFQSYALFPHMTALRNVTSALGDLPRNARDLRARALLAKMKLGGLEQRKPAMLSGGEQQRVAMARALARDPKVFLLDEPFSAVDRVTRRTLFRELADLRQELLMPIVLVTHDLDEAAQLADRMCVLDRGRVLQRGTPADICERPASAEVARLVGEPRAAGVSQGP